MMLVVEQRLKFLFKVSLPLHNRRNVDPWEYILEGELLGFAGGDVAFFEKHEQVATPQIWLAVLALLKSLAHSPPTFTSVY
mmetsp:Transcript_108/g.85  ORF Transcript_108/g.85 Transcript_108/m.85 type:complete len:81 (-) Transcript_108:6-248(-)